MEQERQLDQGVFKFLSEILGSKVERDIDTLIEPYNIYWYP